MNYANGESVRVGDRVLIEQGQTPGRVHEVVESDADQRRWNVEEPGVMVESAPFGLVFWPENLSDAIVLVGREVQESS